jgi:hypothetical protein
MWATVIRCGPWLLGGAILTLAYVADAGNCAPGDLHFPILALIGKAPAGFGQDLKIALYKLSRLECRL